MLHTSPGQHFLTIYWTSSIFHIGGQLSVGWHSVQQYIVQYGSSVLATQYIAQHIGIQCAIHTLSSVLFNMLDGIGGQLSVRFNCSICCIGGELSVSQIAACGALTTYSEQTSVAHHHAHHHDHQHGHHDHNHDHHRDHHEHHSHSKILIERHVTLINRRIF